MSHDLEATAQRVEHLLDRLCDDPVTAPLAEDLVAELISLHTAGMQRVFEVIGQADPTLVDRLAGDPLVAGLLSLHDLHPHPLAQRVEAALQIVRPYLHSHGGDVEVVDIDDDGVVWLDLQGTCDGCAGSQATLQSAVEEAIRNAAPEVTDIAVHDPSPVTHPAPMGSQGLIPLESLRTRHPLPIQTVPAR
jgi:Fe-S cluster biogenesis protein NfuA